MCHTHAAAFIGADIIKSSSQWRYLSFFHIPEASTTSTTKTNTTVTDATASATIVHCYHCSNTHAQTQLLTTKTMSQELDAPPPPPQEPHAHSHSQPQEKPKKKSKKLCQYKSCTSPHSIIGDCSFCFKKFCTRHRLLESHDCEHYREVQRDYHLRNAKQLESQQTVVSKV